MTMIWGMYVSCVVSSLGRGQMYLPIPFAFIAERYHEIPNDHNNHIRHHSRQPHLRLSHALIPLRQSRRNEITQRARRKQSNNRPHQDRKIRKPNLRRVEIIRWRSERLRLGEIESQEGRGRPGHDESGELHDREGEQVPWHPQLEEEVAGEGLCEFPLRFGRLAAPEPGVLMRVYLFQRRAIL